MSSDVRALGRLSESLAGGAGSRRPRRRRVPIRRGPGPARRRPLVPRPAILVIAAVGAAVAWIALATNDAEAPLAPAAADTELADVPARAVGDDPARASRDGLRSLAGAPFARVDGLRLVLPHAEPTLVAFGEGDRAEALALRPVGRLIANEHHRFEPGRDVRGPDYLVLASRGKARPATSSADIVVPADATVLAPVTGRVVEVRDYAMEGGVRDRRVVIEAAEQPSLHVTMVYLRDPTVTVGDHVEAGETPVGVVRALPFAREVDGHLEEPAPHVRVEVKPAGQPDPADPNEPAAAPATGDRGR